MSLDALVGKLVSAQQEARTKLAEAQAQATQTAESAAVPVTAPAADAVTPAKTDAPAAEAPKAEEPAAETAAPAVTTEAPAATSEEGKATFKAVAVDDQGVIYGIGSMVTVDRDGEIVEKGALLQMAYDFCAKAGRQFLFNHDKDCPLDADLVASMPGAPILQSGRVLKAGESLPDDDPVVGINIEKGNEIAWFVGVKPRDSRVLEEARKGGLAFSWGGLASKE